MEQGRAGARAAADDQRLHDALVGDTRVAAHRLGDPEPVLEAAEDDLARPPAAHDMEIGLFVEGPGEHLEGFAERVAVEVVGPGPEPGLRDQLVHVERLLGTVVHRSALAVDRVLDPRGARSRVPGHLLGCYASVPSSRDGAPGRPRVPPRATQGRAPPPHRGNSRAGDDVRVGVPQRCHAAIPGRRGGARRLRVRRISSRSSTSTTPGARCSSPSATSPISRAAYLRSRRGRRACATPRSSSIPQTHTDRGVPIATVVDGITAALDGAERDLGITSRADPVLPAAPQRPRPRWPRSSRRCRTGTRSSAVGLDSAEVGHPPEKFRDVFDRARSEGFLTVAHAGEEGPPEYIWQALDLLHVASDRPRRPMHRGRRAASSGSSRRQVPLTVCPLSNVKLRVFPTLADHDLASCSAAACG